MHDPRLDLIPWHKWMIKVVEVTDIVFMLLAGRFGRSAAMIYRVNDGETYKSYLQQALIVNSLSICLSIGVLLTRMLMPFSKWTLIGHAGSSLHHAAVAIFFLFALGKVVIQTLCLTFCVRVRCKPLRKHSVSGASIGGEPLCGHGSTSVALITTTVRENVV